MQRLPLACCLAALVVIAWMLAAGDAAATPSGATVTTTYGRFVVDNENRAFVPHFAVRQVPGLPTGRYAGFTVFGAGFSPQSQSLYEGGLPGVGVPVLAASGGPALAAWGAPDCPIGSLLSQCAGVYSGALDSARPQPFKPYAYSGGVKHADVTPTVAPRIAADRSGDRLVAWTSTDGLHAQRVDANGTAGSVSTVASATADKFDVALADTDVGWVVWRDAGHLFAARLAGDAAPVLTDLGAAPVRYELAADDGGGLYVLLSGSSQNKLVHLTDAGTKRVLSVRARSSALAVHGSYAVVAWTAPGNGRGNDAFASIVRAAKAGATVNLTRTAHRSESVRDLAVDFADGTVHVLLQIADKAVVADATAHLRPLSERTIADPGHAAHIAAGAHGFVVASSTSNEIVDAGCGGCEDLAVTQISVTALRHGKRVGERVFDQG